ncbi:uncharacterized protein SPPG_04509 [Spizellomyces punctatus DAOM BR117]|uniref:Uncharacterized protein n=1 Tax=Spizellomyces punctatus (strain DAOM BR117) TaxID=645134 RepID=A0A0L0HGF5_SPIPD|nr:uncharacterized protein SPPG_04509 [Spizellomyces punctatus DAOM BR117]KND00168.1 hypothetical protein SPPG_04509 [Spizellomyces punctatus DAOM BR117]|eukprot:XP_016608207.1 hypothetical protein SPPG_04509 [Spizellomyces punctatus DAOM BR117]
MLNPKWQPQRHLPLLLLTLSKSISASRKHQVVIVATTSASKSRAEKTEEADVLLRQFRNLSITETIQKEQQAKKPVLEHKSSRKRHADIVRLLLARVSEKLRTVDKGRGHKVGIQRGVKVA